MINLYKSISEKILEIVSAKEVDEKKLAIELNKRQELINNLKDEELKSFKENFVGSIIKVPLYYIGMYIINILISLVFNLLNSTKLRISNTNNTNK